MAFLFGEMETQVKEQAHLLRKIVNSSKKRNLLFEMKQLIFDHCVIVNAVSKFINKGHLVS